MHRNPFKRLGAAYGAEEIKNHNFFLGINWDDIFRKEYPPLDPEGIKPYRANNFRQSIIDEGQVSSKNANFQNWSFVRKTSDDIQVEPDREVQIKKEVRDQNEN